MKVLVVGGGGREHALVWKLFQSPLVKKIYVAPGNVGMSRMATCVNIPVQNFDGLAEFAEENRIDLTVVGPELPLALGIVDRFEQEKLKIFGPKKNAAEIEGSKVFAKRFMKKYHIPTASFKIFDNQESASEFMRSSAFPIVIKADGLAAGKGVFIAKNRGEADFALKRIMKDKAFGKAGNKVVVESFLSGKEATILAFTDGKTIVPMVSSQDHKRAYDGDRGPNTGGMGAYAPAQIINEELMHKIQEQILEPTILGLEREGRPFKGILYAGLVITDQDPKVLEFNCRFGDPETQVVLPLLKSDLAEIFLHIIEGDLSLTDVEWENTSAVCVVLASRGYPERYEKGKPIFGLDRIKRKDVVVFHAGTKFMGRRIVTNGGRVLGVTAVGEDMQAAIAKVYSAVEKIKFSGMRYRKDIGRKQVRQRTGKL